MLQISCLCINDANKPNGVSDKEWICVGETYTLTKIVVFPNVLGIYVIDPLLKEEKSMAFNINRFGFKVQDLPAIEELLRKSMIVSEKMVDSLITDHINVGNEIIDFTDVTSKDENKPLDDL